MESDMQLVPYNPRPVPQDPQSAPHDSQPVPHDHQLVPYNFQPAPHDPQSVTHDPQPVPHNIQPVPHDPPQFPWLSQDSDSELYIEVLEESLQRGISYSRKLVDLVRGFSAHGDIASTGFPMEKISDLGNETASVVFQNMLANSKESIWAEHERFKISVGISGTTGAGKTTALNALLGYNELLPSGSDEAATGTVCIVHNNENKDPERKFRAEITFKDKRTVKKWLDDFFEELHSVLAQNEGFDLESWDPADDLFCNPDMDETQKPEDSLKEYLDPIYDVWKYEKDALLTMSTKDILTKDDPATKLLSKTKHIAFPDLESFSDAIKPYLDCTPLSESEMEDGESMQVWPLVERVDVWVPSPLLENGLVIEDVPGVSDSMQMRAKIATERYKKLDITIVMSPIVRAADEGNTWDLLSDNHALQLQMDGKLNAHQFCLAASKMDDLNWRTYLKRTLRPKPGSDLHAANEELKEVQEYLRMTKEAIPDASKDVKSTDSTKNIQSAKNNKKDADLRYIQLVHEKEHLEKKKDYLEGYLAFLCINARNKKVKDKLLDSIKRKMSNVKGSEQEIPIFPISGAGFWNLKTANGKASSGFPTERYTGIPALSQWIRNATIPARKRHARELLSRLNVVLSVLWTWCGQMDGPDGSLGLPANALRDMCTDFKNVLRKNLDDYGVSLIAQVQTCNPINTIKVKPFRPRCRPDILDQVSKWNLLCPKVPDSRKMSWATHAAIIRRFGNVYSSTGRFKMKYSWMDDMSDCVLLDIVDVWNNCFQAKLPLLAEKVKDALGNVWAISMRKVQSLLPVYFPDHVSYLSNQLQAIFGILEETVQGVEKAMFDFAAEAMNVHPEVRRELVRGWKGPFLKAIRITGKGCFGTRHDFLYEQAYKNITKFIKASIAKMETRMNQNFGAFEVSLDKIWNEVVTKIDSQINAICSRIYESENGCAEGQAGEGGEKEFRQNASQWVAKWQSDWKHPDVLSRIHTAHPDVSIPREYVEEPEEEALLVDISDGEEARPRRPPQKRKRQKKEKTTAPAEKSSPSKGRKRAEKRVKLEDEM